MYRDDDLKDDKKESLVEVGKGVVVNEGCCYEKTFAPAMFTLGASVSATTTDK